MREPLGYTFDNGTTLCARHVAENHDLENETSRVYAIYDHHEAHSHVVCDVEGCGIILEKNCIDGCGTGGYAHSLSYDDHEHAQAALEYVKYIFDENVELYSDPESGYAYAVAFATDEEFSEKEAQGFLQIVSPDAYDLNNELEDDEEQEDEDDFPEVWTLHERELAVAEAEGNDWTIEYIRRLERIAYAAYVFYVKSCNLPVTLPKASYDIASLPLADLAKALHEELATVDFMKH